MRHAAKVLTRVIATATIVELLASGVIPAIASRGDCEAFAATSKAPAVAPPPSQRTGVKAGVDRKEAMRSVRLFECKHLRLPVQRWPRSLHHHLRSRRPLPSQRLPSFAPTRPLVRMPFSQQERLLDGWRIRPIDGDTFAYGNERIRLQGIDAPEVTESGGIEAMQRLYLLLREGPITMIPKAVDKYGRTVADVYVNGRNIAAVLAAEGYARDR